MKDSIRFKEHQYRAGLISKQEYVDWMKSNHAHLTVGDWCVLAEAEIKDIKLEDNANELDVKRCEMAAMSAKLEDFKKGFQDDKEVIQRLREQVKTGRKKGAALEAAIGRRDHKIQNYQKTEESIAIAINKYDSLRKDYDDVCTKLARWDGERSMHASLVQRNENQKDFITDLQEQLEVEKGAAYLDTPVPGSLVVVHTSVNYAPCITVVPEDEFIDYFSTDSRWDNADLRCLREMESGSHRFFDKGNAISIVRV